MTDETTKNHWLKLGAIALITFIGTFLAFYIVMEIMYHRITDPNLELKKFEKLVRQEQRDFHRYEEKMMDMPFEPKMRPMIVNLVRESSEYKVIVDLSDFDNNENLINVSLDNKVLTISGEVDKKMFGTEKIIKFT